MKIQFKTEVKLAPKHKSALVSFLQYSAKKLKMKKDISVLFLPKNHNVDGISTAAYVPVEHKVYARYGGRALVDVMRSVAHEFVHAKQYEMGQIKNSKEIPDIGGYIEDGANLIAGRLIKMYVRDNDGRWIYKE